jgi:hypothetical protein
MIAFDDRVQGELLVPFAFVRAPLCGDAHPEAVDEFLDERQGFAGGVHRQVRGDEFDHVRTGEPGLVDARRLRAQPRPIVCGARIVRGLCALGARGEVRIAAQPQPPLICPPLLLQFLPREGFGFGGAGGLLRCRQLCGGGFPVDHDEIVPRPFAESGGAPRPHRDGLFGDVGDFGHPRMRVHRGPFEAALDVQFVAQVA